jgi:hypothetical protein
VDNVEARRIADETLAALPSPSELATALVDELLAGVATSEIMVVSPYNMRVNQLREGLPDAVGVGTVDKFQGQVADIGIYSMASSSGEDVPHGLEFLLSRCTASTSRLLRGTMSCFTLDIEQTVRPLDFRAS